ncbi:Bug family tripartite tricarboxylate transporter substrate binding protein [Thermodesulfobacteriota bacterium]
MNKKMRWVPLLLVLTLLTVWRPGFAQEKFPSKPITIIVSWAPGGGMDLNARTLQPLIEKNLGQSVIIMNKKGGGGTIGFTAGAKAPPDGYTVTLLSASVVTTPYTVSPKISYLNYEPLIFGGFCPGTLTVRNDAPWKTAKDFLDYARANPEKVRMSNSGHNGSQHFRTVGVELAANVKFTHVPFRGTAPALMALVGGHVEGICAGVSDGVQLVKAGKLKVLAVASPERMPLIPDVPTFKELGMDFENGTWYAYVLPKGTPKERVNIVYDAFKKAMGTPEYIEYAETHAIIRWGKLGLKDLIKFFEEEDKKWVKLLDAAGVKRLK